MAAAGQAKLPTLFLPRTMTGGGTTRGSRLRLTQTPAGNGGKNRPTKRKPSRTRIYAR